MVCIVGERKLVGNLSTLRHQPVGPRSSFQQTHFSQSFSGKRLLHWFLTRVSPKETWA